MLSQFLFVVFFVIDAVLFKRILDIEWKRSLKIWAIVTTLTAVIANILVFKLAMPPPITNDFGFRFSQGVMYGLFDFMMRTFLMRIMFKAKLNNPRMLLFFGLCLVINVAHVLAQVYIPR